MATKRYLSLIGLLWITTFALMIAISKSQDYPDVGVHELDSPNARNDPNETALPVEDDITTGSSDQPTETTDTTSSADTSSSSDVETDGDITLSSIGDTSSSSDFETDGDITSSSLGDTSSSVSDGDINPIDTPDSTASEVPANDLTTIPGSDQTTRLVMGPDEPEELDPNVTGTFPNTPTTIALPTTTTTPLSDQNNTESEAKKPTKDARQRWWPFCLMMIAFLIISLIGMIWAIAKYRILKGQEREFEERYRLMGTSPPPIPVTRQPKRPGVGSASNESVRSKLSEEQTDGEKAQDKKKGLKSKSDHGSRPTRGHVNKPEMSGAPKPSDSDDELKIDVLGLGPNQAQAKPGASAAPVVEEDTGIGSAPSSQIQSVPTNRSAISDDPEL